jgi:Na+/serine symporter
MVVFDTGLIYALWNRMKLGYIIGIIGFGIFGLLQAGFACAIFIGFNCFFNLVMAITISICCLSISALLMNSEMYKLSIRNKNLKLICRRMKNAR